MQNNKMTEPLSAQLIKNKQNEINLQRVQQLKMQYQLLNKAFEQNLVPQEIKLIQNEKPTENFQSIQSKNFWHESEMVQFVAKIFAQLDKLAKNPLLKKYARQLKVTIHQLMGEQPQTAATNE